MGICNPHGIANAVIISSGIANPAERWREEAERMNERSGGRGRAD